MKLNALNRYFMWLFLRVLGCILVAGVIALLVVTISGPAR